MQQELPIENHQELPQIVLEEQYIDNEVKQNYFFKMNFTVFSLCHQVHLRNDLAEFDNVVANFEPTNGPRLTESMDEEVQRLLPYFRLVGEEEEQVNIYI